jgi:hypothetical protein
MLSQYSPRMETIEISLNWVQEDPILDGIEAVA